MGFSHITCLPDISAAMEISAWAQLGVSTCTTSMSSRASRSW